MTAIGSESKVCTWAERALPRRPNHAVTVAPHSGDHTPWPHPITDTKNASASWQRKRKKKTSCVPSPRTADLSKGAMHSRPNTQDNNKVRASNWVKLIALRAQTRRLPPLRARRVNNFSAWLESSLLTDDRFFSAAVFAALARRCLASGAVLRHVDGCGLPETALLHWQHRPPL